MGFCKVLYDRRNRLGPFPCLSGVMHGKQTSEGRVCVCWEGGGGVSDVSLSDSEPLLLG